MADSLYQSEPKETDREIENKSEEILKEFDKKLISVHELNRKHQELIKNLDCKLAEFQKSSLSDLKYYEVNRSLMSTNKQSNIEPSSLIIIEDLSYEKIGYDVADVVKELKKEVSNALIQIQNLQSESSVDYSTRNSNSPHFSSKQNIQASEKISPLRGSDKNYFTNEKQDISLLVSNFHRNNGSLKSSKDIIKHHWSSFKENFKMPPPSY